MAATFDQATDAPLTTADGTPLKVSLRRALRRQKLIAAALVLPLFAFIVVTFLIPISLMLYRSIDNAYVPKTLGLTAVEIQNWDGTDLPPEPVFEAFVKDLMAADKDRTWGKVATRINYERSGVRGLINSSMRKLRRTEFAQGAYRDTLIGINKKWDDPALWRVIKRVSGTWTASHYIASLDLRTDDKGEVVSQPETRQIYLPLFQRTFMLSLVITGLCLLLGYPIAFLLASLPLRISNLLMIMVLLPFWTSLLVRTSAWIAILQTQGILNDILETTGVHALLGATGITDGERIQMVYNMTGTIVAMTHILLPFMVLPLFSVMKTIPPSYVRAARSLGATPWTAFWRVYFPQTLPGIGAGGILVFILSIGYYITPALVGGQDGVLISNQIAHHVQKSLNWGLAGALGSILLAAVLILYWLYNKVVGVENVKLG